MANVFFESLRIDYLPGISGLVLNKRDLVAVRFEGALDVQQLGLVFILAYRLWCSISEGRKPKCCNGKYKTAAFSSSICELLNFLKGWTALLV